MERNVRLSFGTEEKRVNKKDNGCLKETDSETGYQHLIFRIRFKTVVVFIIFIVFSIIWICSESLLRGLCIHAVHHRRLHQNCLCTTGL